MLHRIQRCSVGEIGPISLKFKELLFPNKIIITFFLYKDLKTSFSNTEVFNSHIPIVLATNCHTNLESVFSHTLFQLKWK